MRYEEARSAVPAGRRAVGRWLLVLAGMTFVMVILGGATRLSGSGLSMVHWQVLHVLPPLNEAGWQQAFADYKQSPQFQLVNAGMTLAGFKSIFWLEYIHRLWGRLIGFAFLIPFIWFVAKGQLKRRDAPRLFTLFILGGLQGALGWFMVKSGLEARPEVSHYRLAAHLVAALVIYAALLWSALAYLHEGAPGERVAGARAVRKWLMAPLMLICLTIPAGALVAGLHAGLIYNTFPLMGGTVLPGDAWALAPAWRNFFDNQTLVQFDHRVLAILTWASCVAVWLASRRLALPPRQSQAMALVPLVATAQAMLGISTLLELVPLPLAVAHQAGAFLLFTTLLWAVFTLKAVR